MTFRPQEFRAVIINDQPKLFNIFLKKFLIQLNDNSESVYIVRVISQIGAILKDSDESPIIKYKTIKIIMYLIIIGQSDIYNIFEDEIYPTLRNACLYNRSSPLTTRGAQFFKNNKYSSLATYQQKVKIKTLGCKFLSFCLQCVLTLASWLGKQTNNNNKQSNFIINYKMLLKQNVKFPQIHQFIFFTQERINEIQKNINRIAQQISPHSQKSYVSMKSKYKQTNMNTNNIQYLKNKLNLKQKQLQQLKYQYSINDFNKESIIQKQKDQENVFIDKIMLYEQRITQLTEQVRQCKLLIKKLDPKQLNQKQHLISQMKKMIQNLVEENKILKMQVHNKSNVSIVSHTNSNSNIKSLNLNGQKYDNKITNGYKLLLQMQKQAKQYKNNINTPTKQQFYEFKEIKDSLSPYYQGLSKQQQIRLKKSLLKHKQILHKDKSIQIGTYSILNNSIEIDMTIIITNLHDKNLYLLDIKYDYPQQTIINRQPQLINNKKLKPNQQYKQTIAITINDIDSRCIIMMIQYQYQGSSLQKLVLILPVTKLKLLKTVNYTSHSIKNWSNIQKLISLQKRILASLQKLKDYFSKCVIEHQKTSIIYNLKCQLLENTFYISFNEVGQQTIRINISYNHNNRCLAQKLMNQLVFILGK